MFRNCVRRTRLANDMKRDGDLPWLPPEPGEVSPAMSLESPPYQMGRLPRNLAEANAII